jgi:hypothetical protein
MVIPCSWCIYRNTYIELGYYIQNNISNFTPFMVIELMTTEIRWLAQPIYLHVNTKCSIWSALKSSRHIQGCLNWKEKYDAGRPGLNFPFKAYFVSTFTFLTHLPVFRYNVRWNFKKNTVKYLRHNSNIDFIQLKHKMLGKAWKKSMPESYLIWYNLNRVAGVCSHIRNAHNW